MLAPSSHDLTGVERSFVRGWGHVADGKEPVKSDLLVSRVLETLYKVIGVGDGSGGVWDLDVVF